MILELRIMGRRLSLLHLKKIFLYPLLYLKGYSYNNEKYWKNRHQKYKKSYISTGDEGLTEKENIERSKKIAESLIKSLKKHKIKAETLLDIGTGIGATLNDVTAYLQPSKIVATDICKTEFKPNKNTEFIVSNIIADNKNIPKINYDLITVINVIEHIVTEKELQSAFRNIRELMSDKTKLIVAPVPYGIKTRRWLIYAKSWNYKTIIELTKSSGFKVESIDKAYNSFYSKSVLIIFKI